MTEYKKRIEEKRILINDMELAGCQDNESQILYRKTKKQISNLKSELKGYEKAMKGVREKIKRIIKELKEWIEKNSKNIDANDKYTIGYIDGLNHTIEIIEKEGE